MNNIEKPLLSICLITYNHASFIEQAVEGVLIQKTSFLWELIIADDCSTDGTKEIVLNYRNKYPDIIKLILQERNVGPEKNWFELIHTPESKYIAYFDGDDYWTDPLKLQKQVDFLENNNDVALCFHNSIIENSNTGSKELFHKKKMKAFYLGNDLLKYWLIPTASMVMRNVIPEKFPSFFTNATHGDLALFLFVSQYGKIGYIPDIMSVYRKNPAGVTNNFKGINHNLVHIEQCKLMKDYFRPNYQFQLSKRISKYYLSTARLSAKTGNKKSTVNYLLKSFSYFPLIVIGNFVELIKLLFEFVTPPKNA